MRGKKKKKGEKAVQTEQIPLRKMRGRKSISNLGVDEKEKGRISTLARKEG